MKTIKMFLMSFALLASASFLNAQNVDTLHLDYLQVKTEVADSHYVKLDKWVKSFNGKHMDIRILAYFEKPEFKKYSQQRAEELFLALSRKYRNEVTFLSYGAVKGERSQRSRVDVAYYPTGMFEKMKAEKAAGKARDEARRDSIKAVEDAKRKAEKAESDAKKMVERREKHVNDSIKDAAEAKEKAAKKAEEDSKKASDGDKKKSDDKKKKTDDKELKEKEAEMQAAPTPENPGGIVPTDKKDKDKKKKSKKD